MGNTSIKLYFLWVCWSTSYDNFITINRILRKAHKPVGSMVVCPPHSPKSCKLYTEDIRNYGQMCTVNVAAWGAKRGKEHTPQFQTRNGNISGCSHSFAPFA